MKAIHANLKTECNYQVIAVCEFCFFHMMLDDVINFISARRDDVLRIWKNEVFIETKLNNYDGSYDGRDCYDFMPTPVVLCAECYLEQG